MSETSLLSNLVEDGDVTACGRAGIACAKKANRNVHGRRTSELGACVNKKALASPRRGTLASQGQGLGSAHGLTITLMKPIWHLALEVVTRS
eukprot:6173438-Pleurochrysis_carterae.AAC.2